MRAIKKPRDAGLFNRLSLNGSRRLNVGSLLAFGALRDFELDFLAFFEGLEAVHLDCGKVCKQILTAIIGSNKAEAFRVVEPLDSTCCHKRLSNKN